MKLFMLCDSTYSSLVVRNVNVNLVLTAAITASEMALLLKFGTKANSIIVDNVFVSFTFTNTLNIPPNFILGAGVEIYSFTNVTMEGTWKMNDYLIKGGPFFTQTFKNQSSSNDLVDIDCRRPAFTYIIPGICKDS